MITILLNVLISLASIVLTILLVLLSVAFMTIIKRKLIAVLANLQNRVGHIIVGYYGILLVLASVIFIRFTLFSVLYFVGQRFISDLYTLGIYLTFKLQNNLGINDPSLYLIAPCLPLLLPHLENPEEFYVLWDVYHTAFQNPSDITFGGWSFLFSTISLIGHQALALFDLAVYYTATRESLIEVNADNAWLISAFGPDGTPWFTALEIYDQYRHFFHRELEFQQLTILHDTVIQLPDFYNLVGAPLFSYMEVEILTSLNWTSNLQNIANVVWLPIIENPINSHVVTGLPFGSQLDILRHLLEEMEIRRMIHFFMNNRNVTPFPNQTFLEMVLTRYNLNDFVDISELTEGLIPCLLFLYATRVGRNILFRNF